MTQQLIVVENTADLDFLEVGCPLVHVDDYLTGQEYFNLKGTQVINLCRSSRYQSVGYYTSLLAEARRHRIIPSVKTMMDLSSKAMYSLEAVNLDEVVQKSFRRHRKDSIESLFEMEVFFGQCRYPELSELARQIFETFPYPLLQVTFRRHKEWHLVAIKPVRVDKLDSDNREFFAGALAGYLQRRWRSPRTRSVARYDLAVLHNPDDPMPPSDTRALNQFIKAGRALGIDVELIERSDYARLAEYDALFIRDTTRINHYTYRFAKKAESEGMVVIDDPQSILRCTNKVFLAELLRANRVPTPRTVIVGKGDINAAEVAIGYPMVLKVPDGSFSLGVYKAETPEQLQEYTARLFKTSELILAQEYLYTEFDWRIGVLNCEPIYASQYFMSKKHWQIVRYGDGGEVSTGGWKTWAVADAPGEVMATALKAANLIGDGFYGVDLKQTDNGVYVIEVNDNPSIEAGVEDKILKEELYRCIMQEFIRRLDKRKMI
ncbi:RimK family protein [Sulfuriflexus mobilis]|uniref:RimK family protein n=1 Tax=Sulfuriflexus mobilis TaxID=1811807 RepID=UPI000F84ABFA|nr:RimK family protein [Sulfuriflexus mobilis]